MTRTAGWDEINFARGQICNIWAAATKTVAFLRLLLPKVQMQAKLIPAIGEINFDPISSGHSETKLLGILAYLIII